METWQDLGHQLYQFLPLIDSPNGLPNLKVVESTVLHIKISPYNWDVTNVNSILILETM